MTTVRETAVADRQPTLTGALLEDNSSAQVSLTSGMVLLVRYNLSPLSLCGLGGYDRISAKLDESLAEYCVNKTQAQVQQVVVRLANFDRTIPNGSEADRLLRSRGLVPCSGFELLELGIKYPQYQRHFPVLELGKVNAKDANCPTFLCLDGGDLARSLDVACYGMELSARCRYLVTERTSD